MNRDLFKQERDKQDLSNEALAQLAGIKPSYLDNLICGSDQPSLRLLHRFERVLGLPENALRATTTEQDPEPRKQSTQPKRETLAPPQREKDTKGPRRVQDKAVA